ncbi:MAG TPA: hypothetical protein VFD60_02095 [Nitrososphaeraceae archaeon]|nr:hypothetical protein [Nitrososphaeraceae archaeon]
MKERQAVEMTEELENTSITLNHTPSNNIAYVVHFGNSYSGASNS